MKVILITILLAFPILNLALGQEIAPPGKHRSTAIIQILPGDPGYQTPNFIANEIASLSMGVVLKAADQSGKWWSNQIEIEAVKKNLTVERIEGTDMARISVQWNDPKQAKMIVDGIIAAYMKIRQDLETDRSVIALKALDNELIAQSDLVMDNRKELTVLIQQYGIPYFDSTPSPLGKTELELFATSRKKLQELQIELALLKGKLRILEDDKAEREKLLPQIEIVSAQIDLLGEVVSKMQDDTIELSLKQNRYNQSLQAYNQSLEMLNRMKNKQQEDRVALKMPRHPIIVRQQAD